MSWSFELLSADADPFEIAAAVEGFALAMEDALAIKCLNGRSYRNYRNENFWSALSCEGAKDSGFILIYRPKDENPPSGTAAKRFVICYRAALPAAPSAGGC